MGRLVEIAVLAVEVAVIGAVLVYCGYQNRYNNRAVKPTVQTYLKSLIHCR